MARLSRDFRKALSDFIRSSLPEKIDSFAVNGNPDSSYSGEWDDNRSTEDPNETVFLFLTRSDYDINKNETEITISLSFEVDKRYDPEEEDDDE